MDGSAKKTRKLLKKYSDGNQLRLLKEYITKHGLDSPKKISGEVVDQNDKAGRKDESGSSRDANHSSTLENDDLKSENFANLCLREAYAKAACSSPIPVQASGSSTPKPVKLSAEPSSTPKPVKLSVEPSSTPKPVKFSVEPSSTPKPVKLSVEPSSTPKPVKLSVEPRGVSESDFEKKTTPVSNSKEPRTIVKLVKKRDLPNEKKTPKQSPNIALKHPIVKFSDVGGLTKVIKNLEDVLRFFKSPFNDIAQSIGVKSPHGILLNGPARCGKTLLGHTIAGELGWPLIEVESSNIIAGISGESESKLQQIFESALNAAPCVLFFERIDVILSKRTDAQKDMGKRIVSKFIKCMDELRTSDISTHVLVIGATSPNFLLNADVRRAIQFEEEININIPNEMERIEIFNILSKGLSLSADFSVDWLARNTPGYVGGDFVQLLYEAGKSALRRICNFPNEYLLNPSLSVATASTSKEVSVENTESAKKYFVTIKDFEEALSAYVPGTKKEGFDKVSDKTWNDIGALKDVQEELQMAILWPIQYREKCESLGLSANAGILLCGPKGCGKTLLAKAIANECSINFLAVNGPELLNKYVGQSEQNVRQCFQKARSASPCIIFFDEIDALCPSRSYSNDNGAPDRVVAQLLTEMDGVKDRKEIYVIGATNRPESIDSALLRPGRLGKVIYVGIPTPSDRGEILRTLTKSKPKLDADVCLDTIANDDRCSRYSGADLSNLVGAASILALRDSVKSKSDKTDVSVGMIHFEQALDRVKPSISKEDFSIFKRMKYTVQNGVTIKKRKICASAAPEI